MPEFTINEHALCREILGRDVLISDFEDGSEQRRERHGRDVLGFHFTAQNLTKSLYQSIRAFYVARGGPRDGFTFTSPFDDQTYNVRFNGQIEGDFHGGVYDCEWEFKVINADES